MIPNNWQDEKLETMNQISFFILFLCEEEQLFSSYYFSKLFYIVSRLLILCGYFQSLKFSFKTINCPFHVILGDLGLLQMAIAKK